MLCVKSESSASDAENCHSAQYLALNFVFDLPGVMQKQIKHWIFVYIDMYT